MLTLRSISPAAASMRSLGTAPTWSALAMSITVPVAQPFSGN